MDVINTLKRSTFDVLLFFTPSRSSFFSTVFLTVLYELCSFLYWNMLLRTVAAALAAFIFPELEKKKKDSSKVNTEIFNMKHHENAQMFVSGFMEVHI